MSGPLLTIRDYEARAREIMPRALFDRLFGWYGAPDFVTNTNNIAALDTIKLRPRVLAEVSHRDLSTEVLGQEIKFPVILAPVGFQQVSHPLGELATARAAGAAGTIMALSTCSNYSIEEVASAANGPLWFQLYFLRDKGLTETLVRRAEATGYSALVLTVDNPGIVWKERVRRYGYVHEAERSMGTFADMEYPNLPEADNFLESVVPVLTWSNLQWLRSITSLPLVIKGVQTAQDAILCREYGADALVVSNHGGNTVQGTQGTAGILPGVVDAVGDQVTVLVDGGIRAGTDVLKCLALGAKAVLIGRPIFWGLTVDGEDGLRRELEILREELDVAMGLCGVRSVNEVTRSLVNVPPDKKAADGGAGQIERLGRLLERGHITGEEFEAIKPTLPG